MAIDLKYLHQRGKGAKQNWWLKYGLPNALRRRPPFAPTQVNIQMSLHTESATEAARRRDRALVVLHAVEDRLRQGESMTLDAIMAQVSGVIDPAVFDRNMSLTLMSHGMGVSESERNDMIARNHPIKWARGPDRPVEGETTINQAFEAWLADATADPKEAPNADTIKGHRLRVERLIEHCGGDVALSSVTRKIASEFVSKIAQGKRTRTRNNHVMTLASVFKFARLHGLCTCENPFEGLRKDAEGEAREKFTDAELQTLFADMRREVPVEHSPATALPWVCLIALHSGMRLEEICQLKRSDVRQEGTNGGRVMVFNVHNGGNNRLKNKTAARLVPIHTALESALAPYLATLSDDSPLFPGLERRASKGKIGARVGELFAKRMKALGLRRPNLVFHSFRHTFIARLEAEGCRQTDVARICGQKIPGVTFGIYGKGELKVLAGVVDQLKFDDVPALADLAK